MHINIYLKATAESHSNESIARIFQSVIRNILSDVVDGLLYLGKDQAIKDSAIEALMQPDGQDLLKDTFRWHYTINKEYDGYTGKCVIWVDIPIDPSWDRNVQINLSTGNTQLLLNTVLTD